MAQGGAAGSMDVQDQRETFNGFLSASLWIGSHIAQWVMLLVLSFAIGDGWWMGWLAFVVIGIAVGIGFRMSGAYWAIQVAQWVLLGIGGLIVPMFAHMVG
ncbi:MAG: aa3-type cytochrome c oxidase subunit IV [Vitreimonas sp.]